LDYSEYLKETEILDFSSDIISRLPQWPTWMKMDEVRRAASIYDFVRNDIAFGYNASDDMPASAVLSDGYGQCNTKGSLFMALLRKGGIPCRFHGFTIDKKLQRGAIPELLYHLAPASIVHSWVEAYVDGKWLNLEGFILDDAYLRSVQNAFASEIGAFSGYGIATRQLQNPEVNWTGGDTFIQKEGINRDFGVYDTPDAFFQEHEGNSKGLKGWLYARFLRHMFNSNVARVRSGQLGKLLPKQKPSGFCATTAQ